MILCLHLEDSSGLRSLLQISQHNCCRRKEKDPCNMFKRCKEIQAVLHQSHQSVSAVDYSLSVQDDIKQQDKR